jgi:hypothetical protein
MASSGIPGNFGMFISWLILGIVLAALLLWIIIGSYKLWKGQPVLTPDLKVKSRRKNLIISLCLLLTLIIMFAFMGHIFKVNGEIMAIIYGASLIAFLRILRWFT